MSDTAIKIQNLSKVYKGEIGQKDVVGLTDLNLDIESGEVFAFLGPNGAGKTTTIKILTRLLRPTQGDVRIWDQENTSPSAMERVGYLPEQPQLYGYLSGREFLDFIGRLFGLKRSTRQQRIQKLLEQVGLKDRADILVRNYSRGMMQRLGLAQALINEPSLLILDEPMASLDPVGRKDFRDLIFELSHQGLTIFFSSHILSDAEMIADRVGIVNQGKLIRVGKLDELVGDQLLHVEITFMMDTVNHEKMNLSELDTVIQGHRILIRLPDEQSVPEFLRRIDAHGGRVISVVPQRQNLEAYFMAEVGR